MEFECDCDGSSRISLSLDWELVGEHFPLVDFVKVDGGLADVVVVASVVLVPQSNMQSLVVVDVEGEGILPDWILAHVVGGSGLLGDTGNSNFGVWVHASEGFGVIGESS